MDGLSREEWLIATIVVAAVRAADTANSGDGKPGGVGELSPEAKRRIAAAVAAETSQWQREALAGFLSA